MSIVWAEKSSRGYPPMKASSCDVLRIWYRCCCNKTDENTSPDTLCCKASIANLLGCLTRAFPSATWSLKTQSLHLPSIPRLVAGARKLCGARCTGRATTGRCSDPLGGWILRVRLAVAAAMFMAMITTRMMNMFVITMEITTRFVEERL